MKQSRHAASPETQSNSPWTLDDETNGYLATLEMPAEAEMRAYYARRAELEAAAPSVGATAPEFAVEMLSAEGQRTGSLRRLSDYQGKPLALIFGNYTCPIYRGQFARFAEVFAACRDRVEFLKIYIKEEHPDDGWQLDINRNSGCVYRQPIDEDARAAVAGDFMARYAVAMPVAIDTVDNVVCDRYHAEPERLYVIDGAGVVVHRSAPGPFHMDAVDAWCAAVRAIAAS